MRVGSHEEPLAEHDEEDACSGDVEAQGVGGGLDPDECGEDGHVQDYGGYDDGWFEVDLGPELGEQSLVDREVHDEVVDRAQGRDPAQV